MDRARGAFAACLSLGTRGARRCSTRNSSATVMARSAGGSWNGNVMSAFSANRRRILSLWLPRLPIDRIKRKLTPERDKRTALGKGNASQRRRRQAKQRAADLSPSTTLAARSRPLDRPAARQCPRHLSGIDGVRCRRGRPTAKTLDDIADWCDRFTPLVALDPPHGLFLDITGCAHLFGGEARAAADRVRRADAAGFCRQRRDRRHLDLRPHADAACLPEKSLPMARRPRPSARCRCPRSAPMMPSPAACAAPA